MRQLVEPSSTEVAHGPCGLEARSRFARLAERDLVRVPPPATACPGALGQVERDRLSRAPQLTGRAAFEAEPAVPLTAGGPTRIVVATVENARPSSAARVSCVYKEVRCDPASGEFLYVTRTSGQRSAIARAMASSLPRSATRMGKSMRRPERRMKACV